jgi:prepilin-type N-terminal cleavage/methylation domain-containing protein
MNTSSSQNCEQPRGFTLLELLIVVAIIAVLATLSISVMNGIADQAQAEATNVTLLKVNRILEQRIEAFDRAFKGSREDTYVAGTVGLLAQNADGRFDYFLKHPEEAPPEIKALARKAGFRFEFPQRSADLISSGVATVSVGTTPNVLVPAALYNKMLVPRARIQLIEGGNPAPTTAQIQTQVQTNWQKHVSHEIAVLAATGGMTSTGSQAGLHSTESSEMLYFTLVESGAFGTNPTVADQFTSQEIADTDSDGLPEFVDGWGNPLRFYRWPTRLVDPDAPSPFDPVFGTAGDPTEVDLTPNNVSDPGSTGTRRVTKDAVLTGLNERALAEVLLKGLPPAPIAIGNSAPRDTLLIDPDDPIGFLYSFLENQAYKDMGVFVIREFNETNYHTPDTYHAPLVISAGSDGLLGLREPNDVDGPNGIFGNCAQYAGTRVSAFNPSSGVVDSLFDNRTNRNKRAGAGR